MKKKLTLLFILYPMVFFGQSINPNGNTIAERFVPIAGYVRLPVNPNSFAAYLREFPLKPNGTKVLLFDGREKPIEPEVARHPANLAIGFHQQQRRYGCDRAVLEDQPCACLGVEVDEPDRQLFGFGRDVEDRHHVAAQDFAVDAAVDFDDDEFVGPSGCSNDRVVPLGIG